MLKIQKLKIVSAGFFSMPDIFVDRENYSQKEIRQMVYEGNFRIIYHGKFNDKLKIEYFDGPKEIPPKNTNGEFWKILLNYGVWLPICYELSDKAEIEFCSCYEKSRESLFKKFLNFKSRSVVHIRLFPIGAFSLNMFTGIDVKDDPNAYFTMEELDYLTSEFYDDVKVNLHCNGNKILEEITIRELFEYFGENVRKKFILNLDKDQPSVMETYSIIDVEKCKGPWKAYDIIHLCGINTDPDTNLKVLRKWHKIGNLYKGIRKNCEIDFAGINCALICTRSDKPGGMKRWVCEVSDMVEFTYLRKKMIEDYIYFIDQCTNAISDHREDPFDLPWELLKNLIGKKNAWIDQRFITNFQKLSRLEERFPEGFHRDKVLLRISKELKYPDSVKKIQGVLERAQKEIEEYNLHLSKAMNHAITVIVRIIEIYSKIKGRN